MLKSMLLSSVRPFYDAADDARAAAAEERKKIAVETSKKTEQKEVEKEEEIEDKEDNKDDKKEDDKKEEDKDEEDEEGKDDENDGEKKEEELTVEDYKKQLADAQKKVARLEKRTGRTAGERDQLKKDLADAKKALEAKKEEGKEILTEDEVERRAELKANEKAGQREFQKAVQTLTKAAVKEDENFMTKVNEMAQDVAPLPPFMIGALEDLDNGGAVLAHLANNPDVYEEIFELPPAKMVSRLAKLSIKIEEDKKPKKKAISKVPPAIDPMKGGSESPNVLSDKPNKDAASMEKFVKQRQEQEAARRKARYG